MKQINASEFKTKCFSILEQVKQTGESITILKHGKPIAELIPAKTPGQTHPLHALQGSVEIIGDIIEPPLPADAWDAERGEL